MAERLPRKAPAKRPAAPALEHDCKEPRTETYEATGPSGSVRVTRCQDCGAKSIR